MIYGAAAVAILGIAISIIALATLYAANRIAKEADNSVKLAMKLIDISERNITGKDL
ncbi:hypothetical protein [Leuconostoc holzapfelii]|uniref:Uncharacterized protein n=1 Tax=Leuconostoc holzapfelii TaxID=434464 RepID=A0A846ZAW6_9LACO|nr:hypothetical protein [Leuconostoc holzapfelii]NKZ18566.1 hypothetical protein [Leuconostoc holzapfelii]